MEALNAGANQYGQSAGWDDGVYVEVDVEENHTVQSKIVGAGNIVGASIRMGKQVPHPVRREAR